MAMNGLRNFLEIPYEQLEEMNLEAKPSFFDHDVVRMNVAVVLSQKMNLLDTFGKGINEMQRLEDRQFFAPPAFQETRKHFPVGQVGHEKFDLPPADSGSVTVVVLNYDRAGAEFVKFAGVSAQGGLARRVAQVEQLGGPDDTGMLFDNFVNLTFPAASEKLDHLIIRAQSSPGCQVE